jgi:DNA modification methylase
MVEVFREVRRTLRKDGTLWLNIGDSYAAAGHGGGGSFMQMRGGDGSPGSASWAHRKNAKGWRAAPTGTKPKDLLMIPAQLALALRADGWYLRSEIVWAKKAPMPESCTDRPTCAHEKVFLLTKSARYFYDAEAVKEVTESDHPAGNKNGFIGRQGGAEFHVKSGGIGNPVAWSDVGGKRNMRNVWHLGPEPFPEAHFATFVSEIPRRAILAGTSAKGVCPKCGGPWVRQTSSTLYSSTYGDSRRPDSPGSNDQKGSGNQFGTRAFAERMRKEVETIGWRPSCSCANIDSSGEALVPTLRHPLDQLKYRDTPIPATVLDPFLGSGTAAMVADRLGRHCIGIELSPQYAEIAERRCRKDAGLFAEILTG